MTEAKACYRCKEEKTLDQFYANRPGGRLAFECKQCTKDRASDNLARRRKENPERVKSQDRKNHLRSRYRLSPTQYNELLAEQGGVCAICGTPDPKGFGRFHVDHDHNCCPERGKSCGRCIRGLLCHLCNIGHLNDDPALLRRKADYIEKFRTDHPELFLCLTS